MGLDKWLNAEDAVKKEKEKPAEVKKRKSGREQDSGSSRKTLKLQKYTLNCTNSKCKYQKIVMKKGLTDIDKICPRCNKEMKVKSS